MNISPNLFEAILKCPTKCWLRATGEPGAGNDYAEWVKSQTASYQATEIERLLSETPKDESAVAPASANLKTDKWRLAVDVVAQASTPAGSGSVSLPGGTRTPGGAPGQLADETSALPARPEQSLLETHLHVIERIPSVGRGRPAQFVPIRFIYRNKLTKDDRLLLAFDAFVLSQMLGREVGLGKIIHGDDHAALKVKVASLTGEVRKRIEKMAALLASPTPPDVVLNRHCVECEFRDRCRQKAIETDDLSLLAGMSAKERQKLRSKGIFTVTQLSYTFRPRRRPKRLRDKREKYHHSLKALAIREKKIHIVGSPELKIDGTPVYLDVEGLPDRDFYYLIGLRIGNGEAAVQHSLWADTAADEGKIWREFLAVLETVEKPVLIHYGSYERTFIQQMLERHRTTPAGSLVTQALHTAKNLAAFLFAQLYFPVSSNGLKEITSWAGGKWSEGIGTGLECLVARCRWEEARDSATRNQLITYNAEDCLALQLVFDEIGQICGECARGSQASEQVVNTDSLKSVLPMRFGKIVFALPEFDYINKTAYWDYQRERIQLRGGLKKAGKRMPKQLRTKLQVNQTIKLAPMASCPSCGQSNISTTSWNKQVVRDLKFARTGVKRWIRKYVRRHYRCNICGLKFTDDVPDWPEHHEGRGLLAYTVYQLVELRISHRAIDRSLNDLFGMRLPRTVVSALKSRAAKCYGQARAAMLSRIHAVEKRATVWE